MPGAGVEELLRAGRLGEAIAAQTAAVKASPAEPEARYLLLALLGFAGEWERAGRQLEALGHQDPKLAAAARVCGGLLAAEQQRQAVFRGEGQPLVPPDAPAHVAARLAALEAWRAGDQVAASRQLEVAADAAPALAGRLNEQAFGGLRDLDDLLGSVLEVFAGGRYLWLPLERLRRLETAPPAHLLDLLWLPAQIIDDAEGKATVHLPVLYPGSAGHDAEEVRLGRRTEWWGGPDLLRGAGQRVLAYLDAGGEVQEQGILAVRSLEIEPRA